MKKNEIYNYVDAVQEDCKEYILSYCEAQTVDVKCLGVQKALGGSAYEKFYSAIFTADGVTGNGSGSYWFNRWEAEEALSHNLDLLCEACDEFGCDVGAILKQGAESADVYIRCYLLDRGIDWAFAVLEEEEIGELPF